MTVIKQYTNGSWQTVVVGQTGSTGGTGATGATADWSTPQTIKTVDTSSYQIVSSDVGKLINFTFGLFSGSTLPVTVPSGLNLTAGQRIDFIQTGLWQPVFSGSAVIRYTNSLKLRAQYSMGTLICLGGNTFVLTGDLGSA